MASFTSASLEELALRYVSKYATTRAKLCIYLDRKIRERGWNDDKEPDLKAISDRFSELGYVDDAAYAFAKSRALAARGYGKRRLTDKLRSDGVEERDSLTASEHADEEAARSALRFAMRRRLGPYAPRAPDPGQRQKWIAALVRAGHGFAISRAIASLSPGASVDELELHDKTRVTDD